MRKRQVEASFKELMICAAAHDEQLWELASDHAEHKRFENIQNEVGDFDANVIAFIADYYDLQPDDMERVNDHPLDCRGVLNG